MAKNRKEETKRHKTAKPSNGEAESHSPDAQKEETSKDAAKQADDVVSKRLTAWAAFLTAIATFIGTVILAWPRPNLFFPSVSTVPALPSLSPVVPSATPLKSVLSTVTPVPFAVVQSFVVVENGKTTIYKPNETVDMTTGWNATIRADVSNNIPIEELEFTWTFCQMREAISGKGVFAIPYTSSNLAGPDCIRVMIWNEGHMLSDNFIFINTRD